MAAPDNLILSNGVSVARPYLDALEGSAPDKCRAASSVPAFPEVSTAWEGFCIPHARLLGIRRTYLNGLSSDEQQLGPLAREALVDQRRKFERVVLHEASHWTLRGTSMGSLLADKAREVGEVAVSSMMDSASGHGAGVVVPLVPDASGSDLQILCAELAELTSRTVLVQEVFAVWHSLNVAHAHGLLPAKERPQLERSTCQRYEEYVDGFTDCYVALTHMTDRLGSHSGCYLATWALCAADPSGAFKEMLARATRVFSEFDRTALPGVEILMPRIFEASVPYLRRGVDAEPVSRLDEDAVQEVLMDHELLMDTVSDTFLVCDEEIPILCFFGTDHTDHMHFDYDGLFAQREQGSLQQHPFTTILNESIRQQLVCGDGLLCPFWQDSGIGCCEFSRQQLEAVWQRTVHGNHDLRRWRRRGCLMDAPTP